MKKTRIKDLVVLLPGITGSALQKDGKDVWALSGQAISQALKSLGGSLDQLVLKQDDPKAEDLGDGIRATRVLPDVTFVPKLAKIDGYTAISRMITDHFELIPGRVEDKKPSNYYEFPYDWRRDNRSAAFKLERFVNDALVRWREYTNNSDVRVIFLAHSMGGLVCRYYLEVLGGWKNCRALFSFGTPYRGSLNALDFLVNGLTKAGGLVDLSQFLRSCTSVYQLLPTYKTVLAGEQWWHVTKTAVPNVDVNRATAARKFHDELLDAVDKESHSNTKDGYLLLPTLGVEQETLQSAEVRGAQVLFSEELPASVLDAVEQGAVLEGGDGTVPRLSAIPVEMSKSPLLDFVPQKHGSLQATSEVLGRLVQRIKQMQVQGLETLRAPGKAAPLHQPALRLRLADLYTRDEPVTLLARLAHVTASPGRVIARVQPVQPAGAVIERELTRSEEEWLVNFGKLPPGLYRTEVFTEEIGPELPPPVRDLFEVLP